MGLLTYKQAAGQLGVSVDTVRRLVQDGQLRRVEVRAAVRIDQADIDGYIRKQKGAEAEPVRQVSPGQKSAYGAKLGTLARSLNVPRKQLEQEAHALIAEMHGKASMTELTFDEMSDVLDWLEERLAGVPA